MTDSASEPVERVVVDPRFDRLVPAGRRSRRTPTAAIWAEGPVYVPDEDAVIWSDVRRNAVRRWSDGRSATAILYQPSDFANGHTLDHDGTVLACEHGLRRVARYERDGTRTTVVDRYEGQRLNSPNDIVVASDGAIWFTDPPYGILDDPEGYKADSELGGCFVFRLDRATGELTVASRRTSSTRTGWRSRPTSAIAVRVGHVDRPARGRQPPHPRVRRRRRRPARARRASSRSWSPASRTASGSTSRATSGPRPATGSTSWTPDGVELGPDRAARGGEQLHVRRRRTVGGCSSPRRRRCGRSRSGSAGRVTPWVDAAG